MIQCTADRRQTHSEGSAVQWYCGTISVPAAVQYFSPVAQLHQQRRKYFEGFLDIQWVRLNTSLEHLILGTSLKLELAPLILSKIGLFRKPAANSFVDLSTVRYLWCVVRSTTSIHFSDIMVLLWFISIQLFNIQYFGETYMRFLIVDSTRCDNTIYSFCMHWREVLVTTTNSVKWSNSLRLIRPVSDIKHINDPAPFAIRQRLDFVLHRRAITLKLCEKTVGSYFYKKIILNRWPIHRIQPSSQNMEMAKTHRLDVTRLFFFCLLLFTCASRTFATSENEVRKCSWVAGWSQSTMLMLMSMSLRMKAIFAMKIAWLGCQMQLGNFCKMF